MAWHLLAAEQPDLASVGRRLFTQFGPGLAFLATVSSSGEPRLHPITVALSDAELYAFIAPGPKQLDLARDGRYAMHAFLPDAVEEEFMVSGRAVPADSPVERSAALAAYHQPAVPDDHRLFRFGVNRALHAAYRFRGDWPPTYAIWRAPS
jgi:hypothetical protein